MKTTLNASPEAKSASTENVPFDQQVAMAAYYRAQKRGFSPGGEIEDWLEAEREISRRAKDEGASSI